MNMFVLFSFVMLLISTFVNASDVEINFHPRGHWIFQPKYQIFISTSRITVDMVEGQSAEIDRIQYFGPYDFSSKFYSVVENDPYNNDFFVDNSFQHVGSIWNNKNITEFQIAGYTQEVEQSIFSLDVSNFVSENLPDCFWKPAKPWTFDSTQIFYSDNYYGVENTIKFVYVTEVLGVEFQIEYWWIIVMLVGSKLFVSAALAGCDSYVHPNARRFSRHWAKVFFGNTFWLFFGGLGLGLWYFFAGAILCLTIVFLPFGVQLMKASHMAFLPFGRTSSSPENRGLCSTLGNVLWLVFFGIWIAFYHVVIGVVLLVPLVTIPLALQHFKLAKFALFPFGKDVIFEGEEYEQGERSYLIRNHLVSDAQVSPAVKYV